MGSSPAGRTTLLTHFTTLAYRGVMSSVTFLGLGTMGAPMAGHLARAGHTVRGWNRTAGRPSIPGVTHVTSLKEALTGADAVVLSVSDTPDVEQLLLGSDGAIHHLTPGAVVIDTSTIAPSATRRMGEQLATKGILMVDAPVSGGSEGAVNGTLTVFLGGSAEAVAAAQPFLAAFAKTITHLGPLGAGQVGKAVNQLVISGATSRSPKGSWWGRRRGLIQQHLRARLLAAPQSRGSWRIAGSAWRRIATHSASRLHCTARISASRLTLQRSSASPSPPPRWWRNLKMR